MTIQFAGSNGIVSDPVSLAVVPDLPHIITTCDSLYGTPTSPCQLAVTHQNGSLVTNSAPAAGGEVLSIWAVGLGVPASGIPKAGSGPIAMNDIVLNTAFEVSVPGGTSIAATQTPYLFAGLSSVTGGLYQVNFAVPQPPAGTQACTQNTEWFTGSGNMSLSIFRAVPFNPSGTTGTAFTLGYFTWSAVGSSVVSSICVAP